MQFIVLLILFKIGLTLLFLTLGAMLMAEFFPVLASKAIEATSGTILAPIGDFVSDALLFIAKYAQMFVDLVFSWLRVFGIDIDSGNVQNSMKNVDLKAPSKVEKPEF